MDLLKIKMGDCETEDKQEEKNDKAKDGLLKI